MTKIHVLHIITRLEQGGAPLALLETAKRMDRSRFAITLVAGQTEDPSRNLDLSKTDFDLPVIHVPYLRRSIHPLRDVLALIHLVRIISRGKYDVVHTHTSKAGLLGRIAASICGVRAIVHSSHGTILTGYFSNAVTQVFALLERFAARLSNRIICLTREEIGQYLKTGIGRRSQYVYIFNGIDLDAFEARVGDRDVLRSDLGLSSEDIVCLTVGRLVPVKGYTDLLDAFASAHQEENRLKLVLVGDGELRADLERQADQLGIADATLFVGWCENVSEILDTGDLFVLASLNEGLGLVLIEAMAKRLPVIATAVGGVPEVVEDGVTGDLVSPRDAHDIAGSIVRLALNPDIRQRMGNEGYNRAHRLFSINQTVRETEDVYEDLLST